MPGDGVLGPQQRVPPADGSGGGGGAPPTGGGAPTGDPYAPPGSDAVAPPIQPPGPNTGMRDPAYVNWLAGRQSGPDTLRQFYSGGGNPSPGGPGGFDPSTFTGPQPPGFQIPAWFQRQSADPSWKGYLSWLSQNPGAPGNANIAGLLGAGGGGAGTPPPTGGPPGGGGQPPPPGPAPPPSPFVPPGPPGGGGLPGGAGPGTAPSPYYGYPSFAGFGPGGMPVGGGMPGMGGGMGGFPGMGGGGPGAMPQPFAYNDPFNQFLAALPTMQQNTQRQLSGAMSDAGFSGNRYGSWAGGKAAEVGAEGALQQNQAFLNMLQQHANQTQQNALTAAGLGTQAGSAIDAMTAAHLQLPYQMAQYEQQRQDQLAQLKYQDWNQNKLSWFPYLLQAAETRNAGYPGQIVPVTSAAKPGALDYFSALAPGLISLFTPGASGNSILGGILSNAFGGSNAGNPTGTTPLPGSNILPQGPGDSVPPGTFGGGS